MSPVNDPDQLKAALDALAEADRVEYGLKLERRRIDDRINAHRSVHDVARDKARAMLKREGGRVMHAGEVWELDERGFLTHKPVPINLDALKSERPELPLSPATEKAA